MAIYMWREATYSTYTFDFQNDGDLWWSWATYTSWEWWTGGWIFGTYLWVIMPPVSVYDWKKLVEYKLYLYKQDVASSTAAAWGWMSNGVIDKYVVCDYYSNTVGTLVNDGWGTLIQTWSVRWDVVLDYILDDNALKLSINWWSEYDLWNFASLFRDGWDNEDLWICISRQWYTWAFYIRKLEITTLW